MIWIFIIMAVLVGGYCAIGDWWEKGRIGMNEGVIFIGFGVMILVFVLLGLVFAPWRFH